MTDNDTVAMRSLSGKALKALLSAALVLLLVPAAALIAPLRAHAADDTVYLEKDGRLDYAGWFTARMSANGVPAVCANPALPSPPSGYYTKDYDWKTGVRDAFACYNALYYGPGSYGYDPAMWPDTWYDGSPMDEDKIRVCQHLIISERYNDDYASAVTGTSSAFREWASTYVMSEAYLTEPGVVASAYAKQYIRALNEGDAYKRFEVYRIGGDGYQNLLSFDPAGKLKLKKVSTNPSVTDGNEFYDMEGIQYGVYGDEACTNLVATLTCGADGTTEEAELVCGTYYVREIGGGQGYKVSAEVQEVIVPTGGEVTVQASDEPEMGRLKIEKRSSNPSVTNGNRCYDLAGIQYGVYGDEACTNLVATLTCDANGDTGDVELPLGRYWVKEIGASTDGSGYAIDATAQTTTLEHEGTVTKRFTEKPQTDPLALLVRKQDSATNHGTAQGGASLAGAEFKVRYYDGFFATASDAEASGSPKRTWVISTNNKGYGSLNDEYKVSGDEFYRSESGLPCVPLGTVLIEEVKAPTGYVMPTGTDVRVVQILPQTSPNDEVFANPAAVPNDVKRGDLSFIKVSETDMNRLANVPFRLTSETTGESHVIVTDSNGYADTSNGWNSHSLNTNANDRAESEEDYDDMAGVWFGGGAEGSPQAPVDDSLGALPYDTYTLEELPCSANEGLVLITIPNITIARDSFKVPLGTIDDPEHPTPTPPHITTTAYDAADLDKHVASDAGAAIIDNVAYMFLDPETAYTLKASLRFADTGEAVADDAGEPFGATVGFVTGTAQNGKVNVTIPFDSSKAEGRDVVVFEQLYEGDRLICSHEDKDDVDQQVRVLTPSIMTTARDAADDDKELASDAGAAIADEVRYENLVAGASYVLEAHLVDAESGEVLRDSKGSPILAEQPFMASSSNGIATVTIAFDSRAYEGQDVVVFERLYKDGILVASHEDATDEGQTVHVSEPWIGTYATDAVSGGKELSADLSSAIVDEVAYANLVPGKAYVLTGTLMVRSADGAEASPLLGEDGEPVTSVVEFTATASDGSVNVPFTFDATGLEAGARIVVFEELSCQEGPVASHEDPDDEGQTVTVAHPAIATTATDGLDGDKTVVADPIAAVTDEVAYEGLCAGSSYALYGILMDASTGLPLDARAQEEVPDAEGDLANIAIAPDAARKMEIRAFWDGLIEIIGEDPQTGDELDLSALRSYLNESRSVADGLVMAQASFKADAAQGTAVVPFTFDASRWIGGEESVDAVAFELLVKDGRILAVHADLDDEGQTVTVAPSSIATEATDAADGDHVVLPSLEATIIDAVHYEDLIPGRAYTVTGKLMDKASGKQLYINDKPVEQTVAFTPNAPSGVVEVAFTLDATKLIGKELVAFESVSKDGIVVAVHADIDDEAQTVIVQEGPSGTPLPKTGGSSPWMVLAIIGAICVGTGLIQRKLREAAERM